jgi:hypothetical protein
MTPIKSANPALARLSFWVPAARMAEFEKAYEQQIVPILEQHGLLQSGECGRIPVEGIFSRLFELESPTEIIARGQVLQKDVTWRQVLRDLGVVFGTTFAAMRLDDGKPFYDRHITSQTYAGMGPLLRFHWGPYAAPAGSGRAVVRHFWRRRESLRWPGVHHLYYPGRASGKQYKIHTARPGRLSVVWHQGLGGKPV